MQALKKIMRFIQPYKLTFISYIALNFVMTALAMVSPYIAKLFFDLVIYQKQSRLIVPLMLGMAGQVIGRHVIHYIRSFYLSRDCYRFMNDMRAELFSKLLSQTQSFLQKQNTGETLTTMNSDTDYIRNMFNNNIMQYAEWALLFINASIMLYTINPYLLLICYSMLPFAFFIGRA
ncbi:MAG TPA: ABC transporter transmembrane domain-containing protein, partial [Clostridia bacterium]|nr:ABC transporter transmembrane domain-containing protein [Clostridia bacterium]